MSKANHLILLLTVVFLLAILPPSSFIWNQLLTVGPKIIPINQEKVLDYISPLQPLVSPTRLPTVNATAYILIDHATNQIIAQKNKDARIYPASTTKLATALTALNIYPLDEVITISEPTTEGKVMELRSGEKITIGSLINALLVYSANDAANALASHHLGGQPGFIDQMNNLMTKYQLTHTHFVNVDGIHHPDHYSTVFDLAQLGRLAIKSPTVRQTVKTKQIDIKNIDQTITHTLVSTNELLGVIPEVKGLKTGWTPEAGGSFIGLLDINGHEVISVVADSVDRFGDTKILIDWLKQSVSWHPYRSEIIESATAGK